VSTQQVDTFWNICSHYYTSPVNVTHMSCAYFEQWIKKKTQFS